MTLLNNVISLTFSLSDLLILTGIVCLIILTIYIVITLKSLTALLKQSTELVEESSKVVEVVQAKSKVLEEFVQNLISNGQGFLKFLSVFKKKSK